MKGIVSMDKAELFNYATQPIRTDEGIIYDLYLNGKAPLDGGGVVYPMGVAIGRIGKHKGGFSEPVRWFATPLQYSPFDPKCPRREFTSRRDAALWLLGLYESATVEFLSSIAQYILTKNNDSGLKSVRNPKYEWN